MLQSRIKIGIVVLVFLLVVGALIIFGRKEAASRPSTPENLSAPVLGADFDPGNSGDWQGPLPGEVARRFIFATTHAERMKYLRNPEQNAGLMKAFFDEGSGAEEKVVGVKYLGLFYFESLAIEGFQVEVENGKIRLLGVALTPKGGVVDFRSYARYGSESWSDLLDGTVKEAAEVRVHLNPAFDYFGRYSNDRNWINYIASSPDLEYPLYFYAKRDSPVGRKLALIKNAGQRVTLSIRTEGDSNLHRQFEITKILSFNWMLPATPLESELPQSK